MLTEFKVGQNAVYPGHGVGKVVSIEIKDILGKPCHFYTIEILESGTKIMVPKEKVEVVGLRPIMSKEEAQQVISILKNNKSKIDHQVWNRRYRAYMEKIKKGSVKEVAEVLRDLFYLKTNKDLSFSERKIFDTARSLLKNELTFAVEERELNREKVLKAIFNF